MRGFHEKGLELWFLNAGGTIFTIMGGILPIAAPALVQPPADGIVIRETGIIGEQNGLKAGDIVVGVDRIRVRNVAQYRAARGASAQAVMHFTIWRAGRYIEVSAPLRYGWIVSSIETYTPKTATQ